jgi:hypothetical protein
VAGVRFPYPPQDCRIGGISLPRQGMVPGLFSAVPLATTGAAVYLPPRAHLGRYAALIALSSDVPSCQAALDQAAALASVTAEPLSPSELEPEHLL